MHGDFLPEMRDAHDSQITSRAILHSKHRKEREKRRRRCRFSRHGMKICIPVLTQQGMNSPLSSHFGQADHFAMYDEETKQLTFFSNAGHHHGGKLTPAEVIQQAGAQVVLCGGLGTKAVQLFQHAGIRVFNQASGTVADVLAAYQAGKLPEATDATACHDHAH